MAKWKNRSTSSKQHIYDKRRRRNLLNKLQEWHVGGRRGPIPYVKKWFPGIEQAYKAYNVTEDMVFIPANPWLKKAVGIDDGEKKARRKFKYEKSKRLPINDRPLYPGLSDAIQESLKQDD